MNLHAGFLFYVLQVLPTRKIPTKQNKSGKNNRKIKNSKLKKKRKNRKDEFKKKKEGKRVVVTAFKS